ncbi:hypothetical protein FraQA3DRAFT_5258 [Frankia sp. QA3]|nr:hypothetical protein FraQA3DRAFT_5258 [Frankia sp. QA3]
MLATPAAATLTPIGTEKGWRFCNKCYGLVRVATPYVVNRCPAGGQHLIRGWIFALNNTPSTVYHAAETPDTQSCWIQCDYCAVLYYGDFPGKCAGRRGSTHWGRFPQKLVPHDRDPQPARSQSAWRFCFKCSSMYFDGYQPRRGVCPGNPGWGHAAAGYIFQIPVYLYS